MDLSHGPALSFLSLYDVKTGVTRVTRLQLGSSPVLTRLCAVTPIRARIAVTRSERCARLQACSPCLVRDTAIFRDGVTCNPERLQISAPHNLPCNPRAEPAGSPHQIALSGQRLPIQPPDLNEGQGAFSGRMRPFGGHAH